MQEQIAEQDTSEHNFIESSLREREQDEDFLAHEYLQFFSNRIQQHQKPAFKPYKQRIQLTEEEENKIIKLRFGKMDPTVEPVRSLQSIAKEM